MIRRWLRRVLGITYSPSRDLVESMDRVDWAAALQPRLPDGTPYALGLSLNDATQVWSQVRVTDDMVSTSHPSTVGATVLNQGALKALRDASPTTADAGRRLKAAMTPSNTHSPEQETTTMNDDHDTPISVYPAPTTVEAFVRDDFTTDRLHVILRGFCHGLGAVMATPRQIDNQPVSLDRWVEPTEPGQEWVGDQPGILLRREDAVTMARAILKATGDKTPTERELQDLRDTAESLAAELTEARQEAVVKGLEATNWECLALEKDATLTARETHLTDVRRWARSLEDWAKPATLVTGHLDETAETWTVGTHGHLQAVPDWEARAHRAEGALEEAQAATARALTQVNALNQRVARLMQTQRHLRAELDDATAARGQAELEARVAGYAVAANDLTNHAAVMAARPGRARVGLLLELVNGIRSHAGLPTLDEMPEPPQKRTPEGAADSSTELSTAVEDRSGEPDAELGRDNTWTTIDGDTWQYHHPVGASPRYVCTASTTDPRRVGATHYVTRDANTPEDLAHTAAAWADRPDIEES